MSLDVKAQQKRLIVMLAIGVVSLIVALVATIGYLGFHLGWMAWVFVAAILTGFAAQGWLIVGFARSK